MCEETRRTAMKSDKYLKSYRVRTWLDVTNDNAMQLGHVESWGGGTIGCFVEGNLK